MIRSLLKLKLRLKLLAGTASRKKYRNPRIRHDLRAIFIHIPKAAGSSVTSALNKIPNNSDILSPKIGKHARAFEVKYLLGADIWEDYFSFAFVRNPWDLMVSSYHWWLQKAPSLPYHRRNAAKVTAMKDFNEFVHSRFGRLMINERYGNLYDWIAENDQIIVTFVGKVENINEDWKYVCEQIGIPAAALSHENPSRRENYRSYYTDEAVELVAKRFEKTIKKFGYEF